MELNNDKLWDIHDDNTRQYFEELKKEWPQLIDYNTFNDGYDFPCSQLIIEVDPERISEWERIKAGKYPKNAYN